MQNYNFRKAKAIENEYKKQLLKHNPSLKDEAGIYFITRTDEYSFKFGYIGQSCKNNGVLSRLAQHLCSHKQHIDNSLQKRKLYDKKDNPYGWKINAIYCSDEELDELEQKYIKQYADAGYQLLNVSLGGQGKGRNMINETKPAKGYHDGIAQGKKTLAKELKHIIDLHLDVTMKNPTNKVSQKQYQKFKDLLDSKNYE